MTRHPEGTEPSENGKQPAGSADTASDEAGARDSDATVASAAAAESEAVAEASDRAAPEADADATEPEAGTKRRTRERARTGRDREERTGAARPKRQVGAAPTGKAGRGKPGRKVVAAPRSGSNRRARAQQAAISRLKRIAVNLAVWIVVAGLVAGAAWYLKDQSYQIDAASRDATSAARPAAQAIFSYDYRAFDESVANGRDFVTGNFKSEYAKTTSGIKATVKKEKAIVRAQVVAWSVTAASADRVEVLLFVNQTRRNVNITGEKVDQNRVLLTMVKVNDEWLVADAAAI